MITRCPACQTAFRVTETQLAARDGQVRCGTCARVFDARAHLFVETPAPVTVAVQHATESPSSNDEVQMVWSKQLLLI